MAIYNENFILLDIEAIKTSDAHNCVRKLYMLGKDGLTCLEAEFLPCKRLRDLEKKYKKTFYFCQRNIHRLDYYHPTTKLKCRDAKALVYNFAKSLDAKLVLYKGGHLEKDLCTVIGLDCMNIETVGVKKVYSHDPREEVNLYYQQLLNLDLI